MAAGNMVDSAELVWTLLQDATFSGVNIYGPPGLPADFNEQQALNEKTIMFLGDGGDNDINIPKGIDEFAFYCYAPSADEARQLYYKLLKFLHRKRHVLVTLSSGTAIFQYARKTSGPQDRTEPQEDWPYALCAFQIHYMEETIA